MRFHWGRAGLTSLLLLALSCSSPPRKTDVEVTAEEEEMEAEDVEQVVPPEGETPRFAPLNPRWQRPDYSGQQGALGWRPDAFSVPRGMEERVQFWRDIYTKYSSDQGILHDSKYVHVIYETVDFSDISASTVLTPKAKERQRRQRVNALKKEVAARLTRLQSVKSPEELEGDDLRYWKLFESIDEKNKFVLASRRGRLRFQLGQRDVFMRGIYQSGRYLRQMEEIFRQEGLPIELTRLPFVESSFNLKARSKVGASGIWQFMRSTGRLYLRMDKSADERNDPLIATRAAARKLKDNYNMLGSWPLAVTAYNHGPYGVKRLTERMGTTDIVELIDVRRGRFKFASASFYASFLAALDVEANADRYFGLLEVMPELRGAEVQLLKSQYAREFLQWFGGDKEKAKELNPHIADAVWRNQIPLSRRHILRVPLLQESAAREALE